MEQVLLWVSFFAGILLFFCRFLPVGRNEAVSAADAETNTAKTNSTSLLRGIALAIPMLGLLATAPSSFAPFHTGQHLGAGFLMGGIAALGASGLLSWARRKPTQTSTGATAPFLLLASSYGTSIWAVAFALLFLRQSLMDALIGVALGGFCVYFTLFLDLPRLARTGEAGTRLACGAGFLAALCAGAGLAVFRDSITPDLPKLAWAATLLAFVALGTLLASGASLLVKPTQGGASRLAPLGVLVLVGGLILYLLAQKITNSSPLFLPGIGGLLLWPVILAVLREERGGTATSQTGETLRPALLVAALLVVSGFMAALQLVQGAGAAVGILALFLAHLATLSFGQQSGSETNQTESRHGTLVSLLVLGTILLLWRFFTTRWASDLRGVQLTDQYALFGLIVGAALPRLLSAVPDRFRGGAASAWATLLFCTVLSLACPAAVLVLFGAKSAVALLIGLALGVLPWASHNASQFPGFFALAISLALAQWTGYGIPVHAPTRMEKIRILLMIMAGVVIAVFAARRMGGQTVNSGGENEEAQ